MKKGQHFIGVIGVLLLVGFAVSCSIGVVDEVGDTGTLKVQVGQSAAMSLGMSPMAITGVDQVVLNLTHEVYPSIRAVDAFPTAGITVQYVRAGEWLLQVSLIEVATGATKYYGEVDIEIVPGAVTNTPVAVYATGESSVTIEERLAPPDLEVTDVDYLTQTVTVDIIPVNGVPVQYLTGEGNYPQNTDASYPITQSVAIAFSDVLNYRSKDATDVASDIWEYRFDRPYFTPVPGTYDGPLDVTLHTAQEGATIMWSTNGTPTLYYGKAAGNGTVIRLEDASQVLQAISIVGWDTDTISPVASGTYDLNFYPEVSVSIGGSDIPNGQIGAVDFGWVAPGTNSNWVSVKIRNDGFKDGYYLDIQSISVDDGTNFELDLSGTNYLLNSGQETEFFIRMTPPVSGLGISATVTIDQNDTPPLDADEDPFTFEAIGDANSPPQVTFQALAVVYDSGRPDLNDSYTEQAGPDPLSTGNPWYMQDNGAAGDEYHLYYSGSYWMFARYNDFSAYWPISPWDTDGFYYKEDGNPLGWAGTVFGYWRVSNGPGPAPYVYEHDGISGRPDFEDGPQELQAEIESITDPDGDTVNGGSEQFQWHLSNNVSEVGAAVPGATLNTFTPVAGDAGMWVRVAVKPSVATGAPGEWVFSNPVLLGGSNTDYD